MGVETKLTITRAKYVPRIYVKIKLFKVTGAGARVIQANVLKIILSSNAARITETLALSHNIFPAVALLSR